MSQQASFRSPRNGIWLVASVSALLGSCISLAAYPMGTDNVESAQVVAGIVRFPEGNIMAAYHTSVQSIQIQIPALLLRAGVSEWTLSLGSIGIQGALSFAAVSLLALAFSGSAAVSILLPILLLCLRQAAPAWPEQDVDALHGHHYPILFPAHSSMFGVVGFFSLILIVSLFGLGKRRAASALAGLMPCIHIAFAVPTYLGLGAALWLTRREVRPGWRELRWFLGGLAVSVLAIGAQRLWAGAGGTAGFSAASGEYLEAFHTFWDGHNRPLAGREWLAFLEPDLYFLVVAGLLAGRSALSPAGRFVLAAFTSVVIAALVSMVALSLEPRFVPEAVRSLIVARWLNLSSVSYFCIALAFLGGAALRERSALALLGSAGFFWLILSGRMTALTGASFASLAGSDLRATPQGLWFPIALVLVFAATVFAVERGGVLAPRYPQRVRGLVTTLCIVAAVGGALTHGVTQADRSALTGRGRYARLTAAIAGGDGLLLTPLDTWLIGRIQLRTRRGVLLDLTQLNLIGKMPSAVGTIETILNEAYCTTLLDESAYRSFERTGACWSARSVEEWQTLRARLGIHDVLVESGVRLQLPQLYSDPHFRLYHIPEGTPGTRAQG
jgi:hypothetical protein